MDRAVRGRILTITVEHSSVVPLHRQIYAGVRSAIVGGTLRRGAMLPSTRALAGDLHVSRGTVVLAYEQLRAEGYAETRAGSGTIVSANVPEALTGVRTVSRPPSPAAAVRPIATRAASVLAASDAMVVKGQRAPGAFRCGAPALDVFPLAVWSRLVTRSLRCVAPRQLSYGDTFGLPALREAVAEYLAAARGVRCTPQQVMIVAGSQQALDFCARTILDAGDAAWLEDPGYRGARGALRLAQVRIVPVPIDVQGLDVEAGRRRAPDARAAFVTPSRQLPLGVTMSLSRRLALLRWAGEARAWIVEDDYESEFRYASQPLPALQGLDAEGCVLYTGTFSKVMFPALRLGYLVVPDALHDAIEMARHFAGFTCSYLEQAALARFMAEGHFERHIRRLRNLYLERQELLLDAGRRLLGERLRLEPADAGMSLVGWLRPEDDDARVAAAARRSGVEVIPLSDLSLEHRVAPGLLLGYSGVLPREIEHGVRRLARTLEELDHRPQRIA